MRTSVAEDESREETDAVLAEAFIERIRRMNRSMGISEELAMLRKEERAGTCGAGTQRGQSELSGSRDLGGGTDESIPDGTGTKVTVRRAFRKKILHKTAGGFFCNLTVYIMYAKKYMRFSCNSIQIIYNV